MLKLRGITAMATTLGREDEASVLGVSSLVDTWLVLRNVESNGERNRLLFVFKARGTAHSNQVREFVITGHGVELVDVYVGPGGVMAGSARLAEEDRERTEQLLHEQEVRRRRQLLKGRIAQKRAQLDTLRDELAVDEDELDLLASDEDRLASEAQAGLAGHGRAALGRSG